MNSTQELQIFEVNSNLRNIISNSQNDHDIKPIDLLLFINTTALSWNTYLTPYCYDMLLDSSCIFSDDYCNFKLDFVIKAATIQEVIPIQGCFAEPNVSKQIERLYNMSKKQIVNIVFDKYNLDLKYTTFYYTVISLKHLLICHFEKSKYDLITSFVGNPNFKSKQTIRQILLRLITQHEYIQPIDSCLEQVTKQFQEISDNDKEHACNFIMTVLESLADYIVSNSYLLPNISVITHIMIQLLELVESNNKYKLSNVLLFALMLDACCDIQKLDLVLMNFVFEIEDSLYYNKIIAYNLFELNKVNTNSEEIKEDKNNEEGNLLTICKNYISKYPITQNIFFSRKISIIGKISTEEDMYDICYKKVCKYVSRENLIGNLYVGAYDFIHYMMNDTHKYEVKSKKKLNKKNKQNKQNSDEYDYEESIGYNKYDAYVDYKYKIKKNNKGKKLPYRNVYVPKFKWVKK